MKKEGWILFVFVCLFIGTLVGMNIPFYITGLATGNTTIGNVNDSPYCSTISNQSWSVNNQKTLNLSEYCIDPENYDLVYNYTSISEITINITDSVVTFTPNTDFTGSRVITFSVFDYVNTNYTNNITLVVSSAATEAAAASGGGAARVTAEAEGEEIILYLAPTVKFEEAKKYYLEEYFVGNTAKLEDIEVGSIIYLGSNEENNLAYVQVAMIEDNKLLVNFVDIEMKLLQLEFIQDSFFELDEDDNGFNDYVMYADYVGNEVVDLRFVKVEIISFELFTFVSEYGFIIFILVFILALLILILKKKV